jgi:hypothetical protein
VNPYGQAGVDPKLTVMTGSNGEASWQVSLIAAMEHKKMGIRATLKGYTDPHSS